MNKWKRGLIGQCHRHGNQSIRNGVLQDGNCSNSLSGSFWHRYSQFLANFMNDFRPDLKNSEIEQVHKIIPN